MSGERLYTLDGLRIPKRETVTEWAEKNHYLRRQGNFLRYTKYPFMVEPTNAMGRIHDTWGVVIITPAQASKTTAILNLLGWMIKHCRVNSLMIFDNSNNAQKFARNRLKPFLHDCCHILDDAERQDSPDKSNSAINIALSSGINLMLGSAKSSSDLCSQPVGIIALDEIDRYVELSGEGDPVTLGLARTKTYRNSMAIMTSTPTVAQTSRIYIQWKLGTAHRYGVICPTCKHFFSPTWKDIDWTDRDNPTTACPVCGEIWAEKDVIGMEHKYEQTNPNPQTDDYGRILRSYSLNGLLMHDQTSWKALKQKELAALQTGEGAIASFYNTQLGETYTPASEVRIDPEILSRASSARFTDTTLPRDIHAIVIGSDTHDDCLYLLTCGFSEDGHRIYYLSFDIVQGNPDEPDVWRMYDEIMCRWYVTEDGRKLRPIYAFGDQGGHRARAVAIYSLRNPRFKPCRGYRAPNAGQSTCVDPLLNRTVPYKVDHGIKTVVQVQMVGISGAKDTLNLWQRLTIAGEQHVYAPLKPCFNSEFWKGLTVEIRDSNGKWMTPLTGATHRFNESTDCSVYAMAAYEAWRVNFFETRKDREYFNERGELRDLTKVKTMENEKTEVTEQQKKKSSKAKAKKPAASKKPAKAIDPKPEANEPVQTEQPVKTEEPKRRFRRM